MLTVLWTALFIQQIAFGHDHTRQKYAYISSDCAHNLYITMKADENIWNSIANETSIPVTSSTIIRFECERVQSLNALIVFDGQTYEFDENFVLEQMQSPWSINDLFVEFDFGKIVPKHTPNEAQRRRLSSASGCVHSPYLTMNTTSLSPWQAKVNDTEVDQSAFTLKIIKQSPQNCRGRARCIYIYTAGKDRAFYYIEQKIDSSAWYDVTFGIDATAKSLNPDKYAFFETVCDGVVETDRFFENQNDKANYTGCFFRETLCDELTVRIGGLFQGQDFLWISQIVYSGNLTNAPTISPTDITNSPTYFPTTVPSKAPITYSPTLLPTAAPTEFTGFPTLIPTKFPTDAPSSDPTRITTFGPTVFPTIYPTNDPNFITLQPTNHPSITPTVTLTNNPSTIPTITPTIGTTANPTEILKASKDPTVRPTTGGSGEASQQTQEPTTAPTIAQLIAPKNDESNSVSFDVGDFILVVVTLCVTFFCMFVYALIKGKNKRRKEIKNAINPDVIYTTNTTNTMDGGEMKASELPQTTTNIMMVSPTIEPMPAQPGSVNEFANTFGEGSDTASDHMDDKNIMGVAITSMGHDVVNDGDISSSGQSVKLTPGKSPPPDGDDDIDDIEDDFEVLDYVNETKGNDWDVVAE